MAYSRIRDEVERLAESCGRDPREITLIAVSKNVPQSAIEAAYAAGARDFGESRVQEALQKIPHLPKECNWHMIGSLQTNKVVKALPLFHLIHSVDSLHLAQKISQVSEKNGTYASILIQVNVSSEQTKHGLSPEEWSQKLDELNHFSHLRIEGLMTMAPLTNDQVIIRTCFKSLRLLRDQWKPLMRDPTQFRHLSMGMSHDYPIAIQEGATLLRIGAAIFE
jgi:pyridoxal phosphate enzyme (YggS family)